MCVRDLWRKFWKGKILLCLDNLYWLLNRPNNLNIVVIGPESSGKTSVIRRYAGDIFYEEKTDPLENVLKTKSLIKVNKKLRRFNTQIIEITRKNVSPSKYQDILSNATGYIFVYDADCPETYQEVSIIISKLHSSKKCLPPTIVVGNKSEICTTMNQVNHNIEIRDEVQSSGADYFSTSAKLNSGISEAFDELIEQCAKKKVRLIPRRKNRSRSGKKSVGLLAT